MRFLLLKNKKLIDLESKRVSSWNHVEGEDPRYEVHYSNRGIGESGRPMDSIRESQIQKTFETLEDLLAYRTATITLEEYRELTKAKEELAIKNERIRKLLAPLADAKIPPEIFEKIENGEFESEAKTAEFANPFNPLDRTTQVTLICKIKSDGYPR